MRGKRLEGGGKMANKIYPCSFGETDEKKKTESWRVERKPEQLYNRHRHQSEPKRETGGRRGKWAAKGEMPGGEPRASRAPPGLNLVPRAIGSRGKKKGKPGKGEHVPRLNGSLRKKKSTEPPGRSGSFRGNEEIIKRKSRGTGLGRQKNPE